MQPNHLKSKVDSLIELISLNSVDSPEKYVQNVDLGSDLASFRINLEDIGNSGITSNSQSPNMSCIGISPITANTKDFTSETSKITNDPKKLQKLKLIPQEPQDSDDSSDNSMHLIAPSVMKSKLNQHTPTFPAKPEDQLSWEKIVIEKPEPLAEGSDERRREEQINPSSFILNFEKADFPCISFKLQESPPPTPMIPAFFEEIPEIKVEPVVVNEYQRKDSRESKDERDKSDFSNLSMQLSESVLQSFEKNNETIVLSDSIMGSVNYGKPEGKKEPSKRRASGNSLGRPLKRLSIQSNARVGISVTPMMKQTKSVKEFMKVGPIRMKTKVKVLNHFSSTQDLKVEASKKMNPLPKLKEINVKSRTKIQMNPYMSDWNKSTLKTFFNVDMKIHKDPSGIKALVTKCVKKRVKHLK
jgi:hypothetical protein